MVQIISKNSYHMYKLNQMLTTSKKLIAKSCRKLLTFLTKNTKNPLSSCPLTQVP